MTDDKIGRRSRDHSNVPNWKNENLNLNEGLAIAIGFDLVKFRLNEQDVRTMFRQVLEGAQYELIDSHSVETEFQEAREIDLNHAQQRSDFVESLYVRLGIELTKLANGEDSFLQISEGDTVSADYEKIRFTGESFNEWATEESITLPFAPIEQCVPDNGIAEVHSQARSNAIDSESLPETAPNSSWAGLTIILRAHNKLALSLPDGTSRTIDLEATDLLNKRYKRLNTAGIALLGLATEPSITKKQGPSGTGVNSKTLSMLRSSLKKLAQNDTDPFLSYNKADGWKPRFKVQDRQNAADERAKDKATHTVFDEGLHNTEPLLNDPNADHDLDAAATRFLEGNDR